MAEAVFDAKNLALRGNRHCLYLARNLSQASAMPNTAFWCLYWAGTEYFREVNRRIQWSFCGTPERRLMSK